MYDIEENFRVLRVRVQHDVALPTLILVGAALPGDGTTFVACGIARAFAEAGHQTLLLDANPRNPGVADELGLTDLSTAVQPGRIDRRLSVAALFDDDERVLADDELEDVVADLRRKYAVTVIDAPAIPASGAALQLARAADGLLLSVRLGRRPCAADQELKQLLQPGGLLAGKAACGIVPTRSVKRRRRGGLTQMPKVTEGAARFVTGVPTTTH